MPAAEDRLSKDARSQLMHALGGLLSLAAAMGIGRFVYTPILPYMADGLNLPAYQAGLIASANFFGYLAGALAGAAKSLPGKPRHWFLGGLLASAATSIAMALTTDLTAFLLIRFLSGVASAVVLVFYTTLILARLNTAGRSDLSALHFAGVGCGIAFSALLIAALMATLTLTMLYQNGPGAPPSVALLALPCRAEGLSGVRSACRV